MKSTKMKKSRLTKVFILAVFALCATTVNAQEETQGKPNVFIDYFYRPSSVPFSWAENLRNCVISGINATNRVNLIDVDTKEALSVEKSRRETGELAAGEDMERLKVMTQEGANFLIQGNIASMVTNIEKNESGGYYYTATCAYTLKVVDPLNGKLVTTKSFKHGDGITNIVVADTKDEAISKISNQAVKAVRELVEDAFKLQGKILEISKVKKDKAEEVYISLGSDNGVAEGAFFSVCVERKIANRTSLKEIGQIKVVAVEGGDISLCEVKKGEKEIKAAFDGGQNIVIKNMPKPKGLFDKMGDTLNKL